jgi:triosephosphate isomerase
MRRKIVAANPKMNLTHHEGKPYLDRFLTEAGEVNDVQIVFIPSYTSIPALAVALEKSPIHIELGAQNVHWEKDGAFTGEVSAAMLRALQVKYVVIGHSERRQWFGETDELVAKKVIAALRAGLRPLVCVGESLSERDEKRVEEVLERQLGKCLGDCSSQNLSSVVIAYEPVWAIGTGRTATAAQAQEAHAFIRSVIASAFGPAAAKSIRVQYGGSVKPENAQALMCQDDIDGALVGGASLDPSSFTQIVRSASKKKRQPESLKPTLLQ